MTKAGENVSNGPTETPKVKPVTGTPSESAVRKAKPAFSIESSKQRKRYGNWLFYGDYGTGKTTLAASASEVPEMKDVLFLNIEAGDESIRHMDLDIVDISDFSQFARVHEYLRIHCKHRDQWEDGKDEAAKARLIELEAILKGVEEDSIKEPTLYRTVIIDTLTEVQKYCMYGLLGVQIGEWALDMAPEAPEWQDWSKSAEMIRLLIRSFRDLPMHTVIVCAQANEQDHQKRFHHHPLLPGKLANEAQGFFDVVGYLVAAPTEGGGMHRRLWLEPGQTFKAKNRFADFKDRFVDDPTMASLSKLRLMPKS